MGTHPIFESDFDCLTEGSPSNSKWEEENELMVDPVQILVPH